MASCEEDEDISIFMDQLTGDASTLEADQVQQTVTEEAAASGTASIDAAHSEEAAARGSGTGLAADVAETSDGLVDLCGDDGDGDAMLADAATDEGAAADEGEDDPAARNLEAVVDEFPEEGDGDTAGHAALPTPPAMALRPSAAPKPSSTPPRTQSTQPSAQPKRRAALPPKRASEQPPAAQGTSRAGASARARPGATGRQRAAQARQAADASSSTPASSSWQAEASSQRGPRRGVKRRRELSQDEAKKLWDEAEAKAVDKMTPKMNKLSSDAWQQRLDDLTWELYYKLEAEAIKSASDSTGAVCGSSAKGASRASGATVNSAAGQDSATAERMRPQAASQSSRQGSEVHESTAIVVNMANVMARYGRNILGRELGSERDGHGSMWDWHGARLCLEFLNRQGWTVYAVLMENFTTTDFHSNPYHPYRRVNMPHDIKKLCAHVHECPRISNPRHKSVDDEKTLLVAYGNKCQWLDLDNYRDKYEKNGLTDKKAWNWIMKHKDRYHRRFDFAQIGSVESHYGKASFTLLAGSDKGLHSRQA